LLFGKNALKNTLKVPQRKNQHRGTLNFSKRNFSFLENKGNIILFQKEFQRMNSYIGYGEILHAANFHLFTQNGQTPCATPAHSCTKKIVGESEADVEPT